ncbi:MAG: helix-turn-helix domain-containing protein [bacterium]
MPYECLSLTVKQVASLLGMSNKWVYRHKDEIPGYFKIAGAILFDKEIFFKELKRCVSMKQG